jgi:hypothetical protein
MLLEAIVAGALLAVMLGLVLRAMTLGAIERRRTDHRAIALQEAAGAMEQAAALPYDEITPERLARIQLSSKVNKLLPRPALTWTVTQVDASPPARQVRLDLTWQDLRGVRPADVRLNYWAYSPSPVAAKENP